MLSPRRILAWTAALVLIPGIFATSASESTLSPASQSEILDELESLLQQHYVLEPEAGRLIAGLRDARAAGRFDAERTTEEFVQVTNRLLQQIYPDRHLGLLAPRRFAEIRELFGIDSPGSDTADNEHPEPGEEHVAAPGHATPEHAAPEHETPEHPAPGHVTPGHPSPGAGSGNAHRSPEEALHEIAGITRVAEISRDGLNQIGYIAFDRFVGSEQARSIVDGIFRTFTESERLILDVRECRGGDVEMVRFLSNYLFREPTHLVSSIGPKNAAGEREVNAGPSRTRSARSSRRSRSTC